MNWNNVKVTTKLYILQTNWWLLASLHKCLINYKYIFNLFWPLPVDVLLTSEIPFLEMTGRHSNFLVDCWQNSQQL